MAHRNQRVTHLLRPDPPTQSLSTSAQIHVDAGSQTTTSRTILQTLRRCGVDSEASRRSLAVVDRLITLVRNADVDGRHTINVIADSARVRVELDLSGRLAALPAVSRGLAVLADGASLDPRARRWGIESDRRQTALWVEIDRTGAESGRLAAAVPPGAEEEPLGLLLDLTSELAWADDLTQIYQTVSRTLRTELDARFAGIALRHGTNFRFTAIDSATPETTTTWTRFPLSSNAPVAASIRDATTWLYSDSSLLEADFPGVGAQLRASGAEALASVPITVGGRSIGALVVTWAQPRRLDRLEAFLRTVAGHVGRATGRASSGSGSVGAPLLGDGTAAQPAAAPGSEVGRLRLDLVSRLAYVRGRAEPVRLTGREFELLVHLMRHPATAQDRQVLLREVWGIDFRAGTSVVDVTISRLRRKLGIDAIVTVKDHGYMFRSESA